MNAQVEVSYEDGTHEKFNIKDRESFTIESVDGIAMLTIYTIEGHVIEANWNHVLKTGFFPALKTGKGELGLGALE